MAARCHGVSTNLALGELKPIAGGVPIVFFGIGDPVGSGFVASLARPGGNITGFESYPPTMGGKWLEVLHEAVPSLRRALTLLHPETAVHQAFWHSIEEAGPRLGIDVAPAGVHDAGEILNAISSFGMLGRDRARCSCWREKQPLRADRGLRITSEPSSTAPAT